MAATELYERVRALLTGGTEELSKAVGNLKYLPTSQSKAGAVMPGTTAEDLGLRLIEINALRRGLEMAIDALDKEYTAMTRPVDTETEGKEDDGKEPIYG